MQNHVTVIPADNVIIVNDQALFFEFEAPAGLHALQWHDGIGEVEYDGPRNETFTVDEYQDRVAPFLQLWEEERVRLVEISSIQPSVEDARAAALETLRLRKWQAKDAGISVNGIQIDTDDRGQATINGAVTNCLLNPDFTAQWKTAATNPDGTAVWVTLGKTEIIALAGALTAHTEACFAVEATKQAEIAALASAQEIQDWLAEQLDAGWPGNGA